MSHLDDLFRNGLSARKASVPDDMWARVRNARPEVPAGEQLDQVFRAGLADRKATVSAGVWEAVNGSRNTVPSNELLDKKFADALLGREAQVPSGLWSRVWSTYQRGRRLQPWYWAAAAVLILGLGAAEWLHFTTAETYVYAAGETPVVLAQSDELREVIAVRETGETTEQSALPPDQIAPSNDGPAYIRSSATVGRRAETSDPGVSNRAASERNDGAIVAPSNGPAYNRSSATVGRGAETTDPGASNRAASERNDGAIVTPSNGPAYNRNSATAGRQGSLASLPTTPAPALSTPALTVPRIRRRDFQAGYEPGSRFRAAPGANTQTEMLFGVGYANQTFGLHEGASRSLLTAREVSEFPELSYHITLRQSFRLGRRFQFSGGLTYAVIRNRVEFEEFVDGERRLAKRNNQYRMLEAPLLASYRIPAGRLRVSLNAGPLINLYTDVSGVYVSPDALQPLDLGESGFYRKNVGVGFMASISTTYAIGKEEPFLLLLEPFFKHYPTSFTVSGAPVKEEYWVAGLQLGVRKGF